MTDEQDGNPREWVIVYDDPERPIGAYVYHGILNDDGVLMHTPVIDKKLYDALAKEHADDWMRIQDTDREVERLKATLLKIVEHVNEQAEDEGLWSVPLEGTQPIAEAYLQRELRALHATVEREFHAALKGDRKK